MGPGSAEAAGPVAPPDATPVSPRTRRGPVKLVAWAAVMVAGWFFLAPTALGGHDAYVMTDGTSMLPHLRGGGLVVTRSEGSYHVGEVVAYRNPELRGNIVLHRIVAIHDGRYTYKGDNNSVADVGTTTRAAIVGKKVLYWSGGARFLMNIKTPWVGALIMGLFGMWAFADLAVDRRTADGAAPDDPVALGVAGARSDP
jgi:signal peptidase I